MPPRKLRSARARGHVRRRGAVLAAALWAIVLLRSGRWTIRELAAELGLHVRSAYRMLHALEAAGVELEVHVEGSLRHYRVRAPALRRLLKL